MTDSGSPAFGFFAQADAYSTAGKIMGRQAAGEGFLRGMGRTWRDGRFEVATMDAFKRQPLVDALASAGFQGQIRWSSAPDFVGARAVGAMYFPAPLNTDLARYRNRLSPAAFSLFGVTHTLSTDRALDAISTLAMSPFKPWDALICTSKAAYRLVDTLLTEVREEWRVTAGVQRFDKIQLPVIPLGVNCDQFAPSETLRAQARAALGLADDEVAVLFAGRLSFHAKANPAALYSALQAVAGDAKLVSIEAGVFPNDHVRASFAAAQAALAPDVRFITIDGEDRDAYAAAWRAADIFTSLSDNIQETFGLTPVEAMAAGLPVLATDWNGYRDNVRHGQDGLLIPTLMAPPGAGEDLGLAVTLGTMSYDRLIGGVSLAVTVDARALEAGLRAMATDPALRARMGASGRQHALRAFDWPMVLRRYDELAGELAMIRRTGVSQPAQPWIQRSDPFARFDGFATRNMGEQDLVSLRPDAQARFAVLVRLGIANYAFHDVTLPRDLIAKLLQTLAHGKEPLTVKALLAKVGGMIPAHLRALSWLAKFDLVEISPQ